MKRLACIVLASLLYVCGVNAQEGQPVKGKEVVCIESFTYPSDIGSNVVTSLRNKVIEGINAMDRVKLVDAESDPILRGERERRSQESAINDENSRMESMKTLGAKYVISGHIVSMEAVRSVDSNGRVSYSGAVVYQLKVYDLANGTIVATKDFNQSGLTGGVGSTKMEAIIGSFDFCKLNMERFVDDVFKIVGKIEEMSEVKKDEAKAVYINLGEDRGIQKGQKFEVYTERQVVGRTTKKLIGELQVEAVEAGDLSLCKVKKGGKEIFAAINDRSVVTVVSKKDNNVMKDVGGMFGF